ncbi:MAG: restriction endonuclease subunit S [Saprospiraceae bacterium]|nr:restriction endonuclease subunit S [Saprospiraceae bacterium]
MENRLPKGWEALKMEDVSKSFSGSGFPKEFQGFKTGEIPVFKVGDISREVQSGKVFINETENYISTEIAKKLRATVLPEKTIVFAKIGEALKLNRRGILAQPSVIDNNAMGVLADEKVIDSKLLYYFLKTVDLSDLSAGNAVPSVRKSSFDAIPLPLPPLPEQHRIVAKLDAVLAKVGSARERMERLPGILRRFRQSVIDHNFSGEIVRLGDVLDEIKYGTSKKCIEEVHGTPVLRIPNIGNGVIDQSDLKYAEFDQSEYDKLKLEEGDVLIIRSNGSVSLVGKAAIAGKSEVGFLYAGYLMRLRANKKRLLPEYLNLALSSYKLRFQIEQTAKSTSGVNNINSKEIQDLEIPLPPLPEQQEIVRRVQSLFAVADRLEARYEALREKVEGLPQALLAKAFRGELVKG